MPEPLLGDALDRAVNNGEVCARYNKCGTRFTYPHGRPVLCVSCHIKQTDRLQEFLLPKAWHEEEV